MTEPAVRFEAVGKRYGTLTALDGFSLEIPPGQLFALVGPNGAGKTTAIGVLTGLLTPTAGRVSIFGLDMAQAPVEAKRRLGFVPDRPFLWAKWTPRETLRFVGSIFGLSGGALEDRLETELAAFGLDEAADRLNETLSHGTRQKVALAQAFLHTPDLLILDEPMVGLDPLAQRTLVERLRGRTAEGGAVLFTTHQLAQAEAVADMAGLLVRGHLAALGPPRALPTGGTLSSAFFELAEAGA